MNRLDKVIDYVVETMGNVTGRVMKSNAEDYEAYFFDSYEGYNKTKRHIPLEMISDDKNSERYSYVNTVDTSNKQVFFRSLKNIIMTKCMEGKKVALFLKRVKLDKNKAEADDLPLEFSIHCIIEKDKRDIVVKYMLTDDDNEVLETKESHQVILEQIVYNSEYKNLY